MTLAQTAAAVGATPRWVLNALTRLRVPRRYGEPLARRLCVARLLSEDIGLPLPRAWELAGKALGGDLEKEWRYQTDEVDLRVDLPRVLTRYAARLAAARNAGPGIRGRRPSRRQSAIATARDWGMDLTLLDSTLKKTMDERLSQAAYDIEALRDLRGSVYR